MRRVAGIIVVGICALTTCACSTRPAWGEQATLLPSPARLRRALCRAATDPHTWVPATGAVVFGLTDLDQTVSDWATGNTPIFGSQRNASEVSGDLRDATGVITAITAFAAPSGCHPAQIAWNKTKAVAVEGAALLAVSELTLFLKDEVGRERPRGGDTQSFPSGHTTAAAAYAALGRRNVDALAVPCQAKVALKGTLTTLSALTGWARVESKDHFPSDVMAGYAMANFVSIFIHDAFLGNRCDWRLRCGPAQRGRGVLLALETKV